MLLQDGLGADPQPLATMAFVWQIVAISLAMVVFSKLLRWKFQMDPTQQADLQHKMQSMQEEIKLAQAQNDMQRLQEIQYEMMEFTKVMMRKQMVPMCVSSVIFMGIFGVLSSFYGNYDYSQVGGVSWFLIYILTSLGANLLISYLTKVYRKSKGNEKPAPVVDNIRALQRNMTINHGAMGGSASPMGVGMRPPITQTNSYADSESNNTQKDWKKKLSDSEN